MRIGIVCPYSFDVPGGVQYHVRDLAEQRIAALVAVAEQLVAARTLYRSLDASVRDRSLTDVLDAPLPPAALAQDALYDAEEYLRSELSEQAGRSEAEVIASVAGSYGAPEEVADIYRETEVTVNRALRPPRPRALR